MQSRGLEGICLGKRVAIRSMNWHQYVATRSLNIGISRTANKSHYEVLGLQKDCSTNEIRESFIRLSKELHPDKNPESPEVHKKFILLNEAYSVLSKPHERHMYDAELSYKDYARTHNFNGVITNAPRERVVFKDDTLWEHRDRSQDKQYEGKPYYGIKGINKRLPNSYIGLGAVLFMIVGGLLHFFLANKFSNMAIEQLDRRDKLARDHYKMVRERALANGDKLQLELMRQAMEADNPTK